MKKELAIRICQLNAQIQEAEDECQHTKDAVKQWKETREALLRELVLLVTVEEDRV